MVTSYQLFLLFQALSVVLAASNASAEEEATDGVRTLSTTTPASSNIKINAGLPGREGKLLTSWAELGRAGPSSAPARLDNALPSLHGCDKRDCCSFLYSHFLLDFITLHYNHVAANKHYSSIIY